MTRRRWKLSPQQLQSMSELYGEMVLPSAIRAILNCRLGFLECFCEPGADRAQKCLELHEVICRHVFFLEETPTATRFWLFTRCVAALLSFELFGIDPKQALRVLNKTPNKDNNTRLMKVLHFLTDASSQALLRKAVLCTRLTIHATSITAQKQSVKPERLPTIVRLSQGEVQKKTSEQFQEILTLLHHDPKLNLGMTVIGLMQTECHIIIRFSMYSRYPAALWKLVRKYNPDPTLGYNASIEECWGGQL